MTNIDLRNKILRKLLDITSHSELLVLCNTYGGHCVDDGYISGETKYLFKDNLFMPSCLVSWNRFGSNYVQVKAVLT